LLHTECRDVSVCLLVTFVSPARTAERFEMPFGVESGGPKKPRTLWGADPPRR